MTPERWCEVDRVIRSALACTPATRSALLDRECGGDVAMRREVESLLAASSAAGDFLESPMIVLGRGGVAVPESKPPTRIGNYHIIRRLGAGGMGIVYLAEQSNPKRRVALKVIRTAAVGARSHMRFAREAEVLGRLKHPGIAQIYEAGQATTDGEDRAFIAMEYVDGETLTDYIDRTRPAVTERLESFAVICDSVHHAHQKGIIHRDLKPGNILVQQEDTVSGRKPMPKVLDFGIARIIDDDSAAVTLSAPQHIIGTLMYMSPEQLEGDGREVDTRSDVYALGVVGYELLSGALPYDVRGKPSTEIIRRITDSAPTPLGHIDGRFSGDLETIFAKALEKDPQRRYDSTAAFAEDIRRFLNKQPIAARPPSTWYQLNKFAQRNSGLVAGVLAAIIGLVGGTTFAVWKAVDARRERDRAVKAEALADMRLNEAIMAQRQAEFDAATAAAVTKFLRETLAAADPESADRSNATIREALDRAAANISEDLYGQPHVEAEIRLTIGKAYHTLGVFPDAAEHLERALELAEVIYRRESLPVADVLLSLGVLRRDMGDHETSEILLAECLRTREALLEAPNPNLASAQSALAATLVRMGRHNEAVELHERALRMQRDLLGDRDPDVAESLARLAIAYRFLGRYDEAEKHYRESLAIRRAALRPDHPHIAVTLHNLGRVLNNMRRYDEAAKVMREAIDIIRRAMPGHHPRTANFLSSYANVLTRLGKFDEAAERVREALEMQRELFPEGHLGMAKTLVELARLSLHQNDADAAYPLLEEADQIAAQFESPDDRWAIATSFVTLYLLRNEPDPAEAIVKERLIDLKDRYGEEHENIAHAYMKLAEIHLSRQQYEPALENVEKSLAIRRRVLAGDHPLVTESIQNLAYVLRRKGDLQRARELLAEAASRQHDHLGPSDLQTIDTTFQLAWLLCELKEDDEAERFLRDCMRGYRNITGDRFAERVLECAMLLQEIAVRRDEPSAFEAEIQSAIAHATERLGANHPYLARVVAKINEAKNAATP